MVPVVGHGQPAAAGTDLRRRAAGHLVAPGVEREKEEPVRRWSAIGSVRPETWPLRIAPDKLPQHVAGQRLSMWPLPPTPAQNLPLVFLHLVGPAHAAAHCDQ